MRGRVLAILVALVAAGCLGGVQEPAGPPSTDVPPATGLRLGPASDLPVERAFTNLSAPPTWAVGEWWTIRYENRLAGGEGEITRVVAGTDGDDYLVGMSEESFSDEVMLLHFPGMGRVDRTNLSFDAHDRPIQLLDFPLTPGRTWTTQWYGGSPMDAEVTQVGDGEAQVLIQGDANAIELVYDTGIGAIRELTVPGYIHLEVVEHGFHFAGTVQVPYRHDLVFCHGRVAVQAIEPCSLATTPDVEGPTETITLPPAYDRVSFGLLMADIAAQDGIGQGVYEIQATAPDGATFEATKLPTEGPIKLVPHGHDDPGGNWEARYATGGPGFSLLEGVAYRVLEITEPAGPI